jgi:hypothetical protein
VNASPANCVSAVLPGGKFRLAKIVRTQYRYKVTIDDIVVYQRKS